MLDAVGTRFIGSGHEIGGQLVPDGGGGQPGGERAAHPGQPARLRGDVEAQRPRWLPVHHHRDIVVVTHIRAQPVQDGLGHLARRIRCGAGQFVGDLLESGIDVDAALFDETVGEQHQCRARLQCGRGLGALGCVEGCQRHRAPALEQPAGAPGSREYRRHMPGTGVADQPAGRVQDGRAHGRAHRTRDARGDRVQLREQLCGSGTTEQESLCGRTQLTHHHRSGQTTSHTVADDNAKGAVTQLHHVVPVAADLQRW